VVDVRRQFLRRFQTLLHMTHVAPTTMHIARYLTSPAYRHTSSALQPSNPTASCIKRLQLQDISRLSLFLLLITIIPFLFFGAACTSKSGTGIATCVAGI
jgi:hypothetical protein